jgi:hypothetical protein
MPLPIPALALSKPAMAGVQQEAQGIARPDEAGRHGAHRRGGIAPTGDQAVARRRSKAGTLLDVASAEAHGAADAPLPGSAP